MARLLNLLKKSFKEHKGLYLYLLLLVAIYHAWFFSFAIRTHGDWTFSFPETLSTLRLHYFTLWLSDYSFGRILLDVGQAPSYAFYGVLSHYFGLGYEFGERFVHMWPAVLLAPIGAYMLCVYCVKEKRAALIGAIAYSANTYALILHTGHLTLAVSYALMPFTLLAFMRIFDEYRVRYVVSSGLLLALCGAYEPRAAYIAVGILFMYALYFIIRSYLVDQSVKRFFKNSLYAAGPIILYGLMSLYWIIGLVSVKSALDDSILSRGLFGNEFQSLPASFTLHHPFWNFGRPIPFIVNAVPAYFWLIPIIAFWGYYVYQKNKKILFFGLLALLGVLLAKQIDEPFTSLYGWLFVHVPGFNAFREASKFYFVTALAYSVLIAAFIRWALIFSLKRYPNRRLLPPAILVITSLLFLPNLVPIATNKIGTTFAARTVPNDYLVLRDFMLKQPDYFRIYWLPRDSRWSVQTDLHPKIAGTTILDDDWKLLLNKDLQQSRAGELTDPLKKNYSNSLLDQASVKYVIVPSRDVVNDDDFFFDYGHDRQAYIDELNKDPYLKRIDIGTKDVAVYENKDYRPPVEAFTDVTRVDSVDKYERAYEVQQNVLKSSNIHFVEDNADSSTANQSILDVFGGLSKTSFSTQNTIEGTSVTPNSDKSLYLNVDSSSINYRQASGKLSVYTANAGSLVLKADNNSNEQLLSAKSAPMQLLTTSIDSRSDYSLEVGNKLTPIKNGDLAEHRLGATNEAITLYSVSRQNLIKNPSLEQGLWQQSAADCNAYASSPGVQANLTTAEHSDQHKALEIYGLRGTACTGPAPVTVTPGSKYALSFDYKIIKGRQAGYEIRFNNVDKTVIKEDLINTSESWARAERSVSVPKGATQLTLLVKAAPDDRNLTQPVLYYDNFRLSEMTNSTKIRDAKLPSYYPIDVKGDSGKLIFSQEGYKSNNLIPNPSLENGLWNKTVGDCDNYDKKPKLGMNLTQSSKSQGKQALELQASRHIACTGPPKIIVKENTYYLLTFDYQSSNAENAGFNVNFDDPQKTTINEQVSIKGKEWKTYSKLIKAPAGASNANILVYAYSQTSGVRQINRYDNFSLVEVPDIIDRYYLASAPQNKLIKPKAIMYKQINVTRKDVHVSGATTPFYLAMSEKYHPQWSARLNGNVLTDLPDSDHFKLNDFMNGWYIDPSKLCSSGGCTRNQDGSYDMNLTLDFTPQHIFYKGLIVSGSVAVLSVAFLVLNTLYEYRKKEIVHHVNKPTR